MRPTTTTAAIGAVLLALALTSCARTGAVGRDASTAPDAPTVSAEDVTPSGAFSLDDLDEGLHFRGTASTCASSTEPDLVTSITGEGGRLDIEAHHGAGEVGLVGDAVFNGVITSIEVGDAGDVAIRGTDASPQAEGYGTTFVITGRCPTA